MTLRQKTMPRPFLPNWLQEMEKSPERGLTLIEVLAVVVILGIISAIAVPQVTSAVNRSKINSTETTLGTIQTALQRYYFDEGQYPTSLSQLTNNPNSSGTTSDPNWHGPYMETSFPANDGWGNNIYYSAPPVASGASTTYPRYILLSGDGSSVTGATVGSSSADELSAITDASLIYAAGGTYGTTTISSPPTEAKVADLSTGTSAEQAIYAAITTSTVIFSSK